MHPGFMSWWTRHHAAPPFEYADAGCGPRGRGRWHERAAQASHGDEGFGSGPFGVRRPLRFLAFKLELDDPQTAELAAILDDLKTERAQAAVDHRRMTSAVADLFAAPAFDAARVAAAGSARVTSATRLAEAQAKALARVHAVLGDEQKKTFAYLLRTGVIAI
jgi:Spy/CpxP family protein refolding chaperone